MFHIEMFSSSGVFTILVVFYCYRVAGTTCNDFFWIDSQTLMGPHMEGSDPHMEGSGLGVSNPYVLRDQRLFGASGLL